MRALTHILANAPRSLRDAIVLLCFAWAISSNADVPCREYLAAVVHEYHRALVGETSHPVKELMNRFGSKIFDKGIKGGLYELEDDAFAMIRVPPEYRKYDDMQSKYGLTKEEAEDIINFYALVFYKDARLIGDIHKASDRVSELHRIHYLNDSSIPIVRRHRYYIFNLTQKSVAEMAKELGQDEGDVYSDLTSLRLSIVDAFGTERLEYAQHLLDLGFPVSEIAKEIGAGEQALAFVLHHKGAENRGVLWNRMLSHEGRPVSEIELLVKYFNDNYTHQAIADALNRSAGTGSATDPEVRTVQSVGAKLEELGLTEKRRPQYPANIFHEKYGRLKQSGQLVVSNARRFLIDHRDRPKSWLANALGVNEGTLRHFIQRHHLLLEIDGTGPSARSQSDTIVKEYGGIRRVYAAAQSFMEVFRAKGDKLPTSQGSKKTHEEMSPDEIKERNAYAWLLNNHANPKTLALISPEARKKVEEWAGSRKSPAHTRFMAAFVANNHQLPVFTAEKKDGPKLSAEQIEQNAAYVWMYRNYNKPKMLGSLTAEARAKVEAWSPQERVPGDEMFLEVYRAKGNNLPVPPKKERRKSLTSEELKEKAAYQWMSKYNRDAEALSKLPPDVQAKVKEWAANKPRGGHVGFLKVFAAKGNQLPDSSDKSAYAWMARNYNNVDALSNLTPEARAKVIAWGAKRDKKEVE